jgi:hypothetical protein
MFLVSGPVMALNQWTVMLYLVSDDSESTSMVHSHLEALNQMASRAGTAGSYEVIVQVDAPPGFKFLSSATKKADGAFRLEPGTSGKWSVAAELGEVNMGSPDCLWDFLKWAAKEHPAKQYALFVAGHGSGIFSWRGDGNVNSSNPGLVKFNPDRFVGYDDTDDDCLTLFEMGAVLEAFKSRLTGGRPIDILALDSCMPGALEALYQFRDLVKLMVSSPSTTLIGGMPYARIIGNLAAQPAMVADEFAKMIAKEYVNKVANMSNEGEVMGVYRPAEAAAIAGAMDQLSLELLRVYQEGTRLSFKNLTTYGGKKRYWDLGRFLTSLAEGGTSLSGVAQPDRVRSVAKEALEALQASRVTTWYVNEFADQKVAGLSIAWPEKPEFLKWRKFYQALDYAKNTHWDEFLDYWYDLK